MQIEQRGRVIGVIGGVGCGKSSVMAALQEQPDCYLIQSDHIGHDLMAKGEVLYEPVVSAFGQGILDAKQEIDRAKLGRLVFSNVGSRTHLNRLSHPLIEARIRKITEEKRSSSSFVFIETALPQELHFTAFCDEIWWIKTPREMRIKQLMETRAYDFLHIQGILRSQPTDLEYAKLATVVLENSGTKEDLQEQVGQQLHRLRRESICR